MSQPLRTTSIPDLKMPSVLKAFDIFNPVSLPERTAAEFIDYGVKLKFANQCQLPMLGLKGVRAPLRGSKLDLEVPLSKT